MTLKMYSIALYLPFLKPVYICHAGWIYIFICDNNKLHHLFLSLAMILRSIYTPVIE